MLLDCRIRAAKAWHMHGVGIRQEGMLKQHLDRSSFNDTMYSRSFLPNVHLFSSYLTSTYYLLECFHSKSTIKVVQHQALWTSAERAVACSSEYSR